MIYKTTILGREISNLPTILKTKQGLKFIAKIINIEFFGHGKTNIIELSVCLFEKIWVSFKIADVEDKEYKDFLFIENVKYGISEIISRELEQIKND